MKQLRSEHALDKLNEKVEFSLSYLILMAMSGILAAVALLSTSIPILIGSMIIAPSLPPLGLVSVSLYERKPNLAWKGAWIIAVGLIAATLFAIFTTWILNVANVVPPDANLLQKPLLEERVRPGWFSVVAAFAAGISGMIALADEKIDIAVGVVASLALVPAAAAGGIALLSRDPEKSLGGFGLLGINILMIILTGYMTLYFLAKRRKEKGGTNS